MGLLTGPGRSEVAPQPATRERILTFHSPSYLDALIAAESGHLDVEGLRMGIGTEDCPVFKGLVAYASLAAGATMKAAEVILAGEADVAFNPSGGYHHAGPSKASGFCYINDVVLACKKLVAVGKRVVFLDIDVHHGDGVQWAFYDSPDVMTISLHESGKTLFPWGGFEEEVGDGDGLGYCANVPLPPGTTDSAFLRALDAVAIPLIRAYNPDVIVLEMGMDMLAADPLAHLNLTNNAYCDAIERILACRRPLLAVGGGGYNVENTARGWALAWTVFCGEDGGWSDMSLGLGGVMLGTSEWQGGLRDPEQVPDPAIQAEVDRAVDETIRKVKLNVFPYHGLTD